MDGGSKSSKRARLYESDSEEISDQEVIFFCFSCFLSG